MNAIKEHHTSAPSQTGIQKLGNSHALRSYVLALVTGVMADSSFAHYAEHLERHVRHPHDGRPVTEILETDKKNGGFFGEQLFLDACIKVGAEGKKCLGLTWSTYLEDHKKKIDFTGKMRLENGNSIPCGIQFTTNPKVVDQKYEQVLQHNEQGEKNQILGVICVDSSIEGGTGIGDFSNTEKTPLETLPIEKQTYWMNRVREINTHIRSWLSSGKKELDFKDDSISIKLKRI